MFINSKNILIVILVLSAIIRLYRLDYPNRYMFDEVYHAYTAKEYLKGNKDAWSPWGKSEPGVAFEWLHPPVEKEIMTVSMYLLSTTDAWAWRLPGALLGIFSIFLVYKLALLLFNYKTIAVLSAFIFSIDGLVFVQSRIGMNDIYLTTFILISVIFFLQKKYILASIFMGISLATKWPGIFLLMVYYPILFYQRQFSKLIYFILIPPLIYLISYTPYFLLGYQFSDFIELHRQIWWYQTNLKATHDYSSPWWSWPLNLYSVWYFVDYKDNSMANIFASGNPVVFWAGAVSVILTSLEAFKRKSFNLLIIVAGFLVFWLPWAFSPRIMFLYHFSPSVPFMCISLGYQLSQDLSDKKRRKLVFVLLTIMIISFTLFFPFFTGIHLPGNFINFFFSTNLTKNPF